MSQNALVIITAASNSTSYSRAVLAAAHATDALELLHAVSQWQQVQHLAKAAPPEVTCGDRRSGQHRMVVNSSLALSQHMGGTGACRLCWCVPCTVDCRKLTTGSLIGQQPCTTAECCMPCLTATTIIYTQAHPVTHLRGQPR
jgi:hypothetical protein